MAFFGLTFLGPQKPFVDELQSLDINSFSMDDCNESFVATCGARGTHAQISAVWEHLYHGEAPVDEVEFLKTALKSYPEFSAEQFAEAVCALLAMKSPPKSAAVDAKPNDETRTERQPRVQFAETNEGAFRPRW